MVPATLSTSYVGTAKGIAEATSGYDARGNELSILERTGAAMGAIPGAATIRKSLGGLADSARGLSGAAGDAVDTVGGLVNSIKKSPNHLSPGALPAPNTTVPGTFPSNPAEFLSEIPHKVKPNGNRVIQPSERIRIRAETHPMKPGETYSPRHHGQHYHVETRIDPTKSWNNKNNVQKVYPPNYDPGHGTGFLPGEAFPGN